VFETIAHVQDPSMARVLITALKAHGFHPLESGGVVGPRGIPILVPEEEMRDAKVLAEDLLREMDV
jgi:hypothetical protein